MPVVIPISSEFASFSQEVILDNVVYRFKFCYNSRYDFWSMSILNKDLEMLVSGIKVVPGYELISLWVDKGLPSGNLFAVDTTGDELRVNRNNLGDPIQLVYISEEELDTI